MLHAPEVTLNPWQTTSRQSTPTHAVVKGRSCARPAGRLLKDWTAFPFPMDNLERLNDYHAASAGPNVTGPTFYRHESLWLADQGTLAVRCG